MELGSVSSPSSFYFLLRAGAWFCSKCARCVTSIAVGLELGSVASASPIELVMELASAASPASLRQEKTAEENVFAMIERVLLTYLLLQQVLLP